MIGIFLCLSFLMYGVLVDVLILKNLRQIVKSEKRFQEIKQKTSKVNLRKKIKKGKFTISISSFPLTNECP